MEETNAWEEYKNDYQSAKKSAKKTSKTSSNSKPKKMNAFAEKKRNNCLMLAKIWHISAILAMVGIFFDGIFVASNAESVALFVYYMIAAFFAFMICETISEVINWLVSKK